MKSLIKSTHTVPQLTEDEKLNILHRQRANPAGVDAIKAAIERSKPLIEAARIKIENSKKVLR